MKIIISGKGKALLLNGRVVTCEHGLRLKNGGREIVVGTGGNLLKTTLPIIVSSLVVLEDVELTVQGGLDKNSVHVVHASSKKLEFVKQEVCYNRAIFIFRGKKQERQVVHSLGYMHVMKNARVFTSSKNDVHHLRIWKKGLLVAHDSSMIFADTHEPELVSCTGKVILSHPHAPGKSLSGGSVITPGGASVL
jgi:hypothetical protein